MQSFKDIQLAAQLDPNMAGIDVWLKRARHAAHEGGDRRNYYKLLRLFCECDQEDVERNFRLVVQECNSISSQSTNVAECLMAEDFLKCATDAHQVLGCATKRHQYDFGCET